VTTEDNGSFDVSQREKESAVVRGRGGLTANQTKAVKAIS